MSCHDYEGVMSVLCTPLQVKYTHYTIQRFGVYKIIFNDF